MTPKITQTSPMADSGDEFLRLLDVVAKADVAGLKKAQQSYGNSWKSRGGVGAFMMLARKWDRLENRLKKTNIGGKGEHFMEPLQQYDIFAHVVADTRAEGVIDDIRDLRRYLMLVEAELLARGHELGIARDNVDEPAKVPPFASLAPCDTEN